MDADNELVDARKEITELKCRIIRLETKFDNLFYKFFGHSHLENGSVERNFGKEEEARKKVRELVA